MSFAKKLLVMLFVAIIAVSMFGFSVAAEEVATETDVAVEVPDFSDLDYSDVSVAKDYLDNYEKYNFEKDENGNANPLYDEDHEDHYSAAVETAFEYLDGYTEHKNPQSEDYDENHKEHYEFAIKTAKTERPLYASFWALVPPIIAIALALITKEVFSSLFIGIVVGGVLSANFSPTGSMDNIVSAGFIDAISNQAGIFMFLVLLGIMVVLINKSGASAAFGRWAEKHIKSKVGASIATFILGVLIFIDDYFNCLTVGSVMRPVTDKAKISRSKFAYLIDATAAPVCMIAPISSWAAAVSTSFPEGKGIGMFIEAIPYNFYSILTFVFIISLTLMKFDYGPMRKHELMAMRGDLYGGKKPETAVTEEAEKGSARGKVVDLILPIIILIVCSVAALLYVGNGNSFSGINIVKAFSDTDATVGLPWGALITLFVVVIYMLIRRVVNFKSAMDSIPAGFKAMVSAILILTMATALKNMTTMLGAKIFVAQLMENAADNLNLFLPAIIFVVACILSFSTGTSWGTFGILIPIVIVLFPDPADHTVMVIGMSACLAGAVCGDHCSPISDTTIMSSAGAQCDHINHVSTQLPYAITVAAISFVNFLIAPFIQNAWICLPVGVAMIIATLFVIKFATKNKSVE